MSSEELGVRSEELISPSAMELGIGHWAFCAPLVLYSCLKRSVAKQRIPKLLTANCSLLTRAMQRSEK